MLFIVCWISESTDLKLASLPFIFTSQSNLEMFSLTTLAFLKTIKSCFNYVNLRHININKLGKKKKKWLCGCLLTIKWLQLQTITRHFERVTKKSSRRKSDWHDNMISGHNTKSAIKCGLIFEWQWRKTFFQVDILAFIVKRDTSRHFVSLSCFVTI